MPKKSLIAVIAGVVLLLVCAGAVFAVDSSNDDKIAKGVSVGGVDVGGLTVGEAKAKLQREYVAPLNRAIVVQARDKTFRLGAKEARTTVDVDATVAVALARSREGNAVARTWRSVTGGELDVKVPAEVDYDHDAVSRLIDRVRVATDVKARDAKVAVEADDVTVQSARKGIAVNLTTLRNTVKTTLADPSQDREITATVRTTKPKVSNGQLAKKYPTIVLVDRGAFTLRLFKQLKLVKTYGIAVGAAGLETPAGMYPIANMAVNPAWHVPNSAWAGDLAGTVVPPGPSNPIKARWMGLYDGVGIHGTSDDASIGSNASHGCIRMHVWDVEELYERVKVGTPVYVT
ncbi:MAG: L,D-transpeptidase/peptidoglycan binding protein [Solirubrobacteraceae bacterium]|nr:L,D-transpeptidase/peptidoglycan binding protein [Solirubrobacteraceae bacterium]